MNKFGVFVFVLASTLAAAQINTGLDDNASAWVICTLPTCDPGGLNPATSASVANKTSPARDGNSLYVTLSGPGYANALFYRTLPSTAANYFMLDLWFYVSSNAWGQTDALEYDVFAYNYPYRWMFGSQCVNGGDWWGWNDLTKTWVDLKIKCSVVVNAWHHLTWWAHRDNSRNCSAMPCSYQDELVLDSNYYPVNLVTPASWLPSGWGNASGVNVQLDTNASGKSSWEWVDQITLTEVGQ